MLFVFLTYSGGMSPLPLNRDQAPLLPLDRDQGGQGQLNTSQQQQLHHTPPRHVLARCNPSTVPRAFQRSRALRLVRPCARAHPLRSKSRLSSLAPPSKAPPPVAPARASRASRRRHAWRHAPRPRPALCPRTAAAAAVPSPAAAAAAARLRRREAAQAPPDGRKSGRAA